MIDPLATFDAMVTAYKKVRELSEKIHDADLRTAIADLYLGMADLKVSLADSREEIAALRQELLASEEKKKIRNRIRVDGPLRYLTDPDPGMHEGPFCSLCLERDDQLISLTGPSRSPVNDSMLWRCPACKQTITDPKLKGNYPQGPSVVW